MNEVTIVDVPSAMIPVSTPEDTIKLASRVATVLTDIIKKQGLYTRIGTKDYPHVDAWICLGNMMGTSVREKEVVETDDGDFIAKVALFSERTGEEGVEATGMCGSDEATWKTRPRFARRSMAITRATGKAFRLKYSWVMCMAGYAATPEEEMPGSAADKRIKDAPTVPEKKGTYTGTTEQQKATDIWLRKHRIDSKYDGLIHEAFMGKPNHQLKKIVKEVTGVEIQ